MGAMKSKPKPSRKVYTTKPVVEGERVVWVCHDEDGDWQFFGETYVCEDDGRIIHLGHLLDQDESLRQVLHMPIGFAATRNDETSGWDIAPYEEDDDDEED
ncbi:hypothetical protein SAMN05192558_105201 [Actinokineospora alba]|uniref:DUF2185 domain-containing protein n=2 Tax=Actinokineospora alba TaxID=504798 RepID=A0A1H0N550_9PSEU|nr:hypothetical protein C8E96_4137 [Actinokineospora alba]SDH81960.1 hypothetical protein SAMN05421871_102251 [Actinokineospora alba]SDO87773.1 hypothetical protein SAMN05192558_105201 [Actinokineospora alba]